MAGTRAQFAPFAEMMQARGLPGLAIEAFRRHYVALAEGATGTIPESALQPVPALPDANALSPTLESVGRDALPATAVLKLNGGLGTGMGLDMAKSLMDARPGESFLRIICRQCAAVETPLILMNSDRTRGPCMEALLPLHQELPALRVRGFLQHMAPKVARNDLAPARWPPDPAHEWYPPGHGDLYAALYCSGTLKALLDSGHRYLFISNADNLGAGLDLRILGHFVGSGLPFLMEVTERTAADRKGGHLARAADGGLLLRESAQCPPGERAPFEDVGRHGYFNTNNLWVDLVVLKTLLENDVPALPLIVNPKTVDPTDPASTPVYQLESAMGAAIGIVPGAAAIHVARDRFTPVKNTADLLLLRSDLFVLGPRGELLRAGHGGPLPQVTLDPHWFGRARDFERRFPGGVPSLRYCTGLRVTGDVLFAPGVVLEGEVAIVNESPFQRVLAGGRSYTGNIRVGGLSAPVPPAGPGTP